MRTSLSKFLPPLYPLLAKEGKEGWSIWLRLCCCSVPFVLCSRIFVEGAAGQGDLVGCLSPIAPGQKKNEPGN